MTSTGKRGTDFIGVGVGAVILNDQRHILLALRKRPPEAGYWTIPGGAVEWFETCEDALRRECREEVGLEVEIRKMLTIVDHIIRPDKAHWVSAEYFVKVVSGNPLIRDKGEIDELDWFPLDALPDPITQPTKLALDAYYRSCGEDSIYGS